MDNLRPLSRSLPSQTPAGATTMTASTSPNETVLQSFKDAALSVTKLYKSAALACQNARKEGYQDAMEDLLNFLDREDLGLSDGEGWRVRMWATERLDSSDAAVARDDKEESEEEGEHAAARRNDTEAPKARTPDAPEQMRERSTRGKTAPAESAVRCSEPAASISSTHPKSQTTSISPSPNSPPQDASHVAAIPPPDLTHHQTSIHEPMFARAPPTEHGFTFRVPHPTGAARSSVEPSPMDTDEPANKATITAIPPSAPARRKIARSKHASLRERDHARERDARLGNGAGAKRKFAMTDFFDFGDVGAKEWPWSGSRDRDGGGGNGGGGGGKKGRSS